MSTNHTPNYALSQWEAGDQILRADFNQDNAKIDAALAELQAGQLRLYCGSYKGTSTTDFSFPVPCTPKVMLIQKTSWEDEKLLLIGEHCIMLIKTEDGATLCKTNGDRFTFKVIDNVVHIHTSFESGFLHNTQILNMNNVIYMYFILA